MRKETIEIFGDPIPTSLLPLARAVDAAINEAVAQVPELRDTRKELENVCKRLQSMQDEKADAIYLYPRNLGSHYYPGVSPDGRLTNTSNCKYCECWMGSSRSGAPEGVDPKGECPGNPKLREAYELLKKTEHVAR